MDRNYRDEYRRRYTREWFDERIAELSEKGVTDPAEAGRQIAADMPDDRLRDFAEWAAPFMVRRRRAEVTK